MSNDVMSVLSAAIAATGPMTEAERDFPEEYEARVMFSAGMVAAMANERSNVAKHVDSMMNPGQKEGAFIGVITAVERERSSNRGIVHVDTESKDGEVKEEALRTRRGEDAYGRLMVKTARSLIGHRVVIHKRQEQFTDGSGKNFRVVAYIQDLGVDDRYELDYDEAGRPVEAFR